METLSFKPRQVIKDLLGRLSTRARDVIRKRYGLDSADSFTLEAIGQIYDITRERVRQIEDFSVKQIRKSETFGQMQPVFNELRRLMDNHGGVVHEREFLNHLSKNQVEQNNIHFLLVLGNEFAHRKENDELHHRWTIDERQAERVEESLKRTAAALSPKDLLTEDEMVKIFIKHLDDSLKNDRARDLAHHWLLLSKLLGVSPVGEWGLAQSPSVKVRGIRDYAFLVLRKHGSPMHFTEVAQAIKEFFGKRSNAATCHNELIKDERFVLVGRGIYALTDWGYRPGVVREVIEAILREHGPLTQHEVLEKVLKERYVKPNTILINLKNPNYFSEDSNRRFNLI